MLALVLLASCKKSSSSSSSGGGTITATVDGTQMTFNNILVAKDTSYMGAYALSFAGASSLTANTPELSLTVDGTSPITTGTYTLNATSPTTDLPGLAYAVGSSLVYGSDISGTNSTTVVITSLSKTNVQGTFSGMLTLQLGTGATTKTVTNGKFNVNFK